MSIDKSKTWRLSERDLDFLVDTVSPEVTDNRILNKSSARTRISEIHTWVMPRYFAASCTTVRYYLFWVYFRFMPNETTAMRLQDRYGPASPTGDGSAPRTTKKRDNGFIAWLRNTEPLSTLSCPRSFGCCMKISKKQKNR